jgi:hypothetical protein
MRAFVKVNYIEVPPKEKIAMMTILLSSNGLSHMKQSQNEAIFLWL